MRNEDKLERFSTVYFKSLIVPLLPADKKAKILDIGCGYGRYIKVLKEIGYVNVEGIDISSEQITYAKTKLGLSNVFNEDAFDWLEVKKDYNCIIVMDLLEHFDLALLRKLMKLIEKALGRSGTLIIQVPNAYAPFLILRYDDFTHERAFTSQSIKQLLRHYNFTGIKHYEAAIPVHGLASLIRRIIWELFIKPLMTISMYILYGKCPGNGIYTASIISVAFKK